MSREGVQKVNHTQFEQILDGQSLVCPEVFFKLTPDRVHIGHANTLEDSLQTQIEQWWKTESFGTKFSKQDLRSIEDERALERLRETTRFRHDLGHYETGLLWRQKKVKLPNNVVLAEKRLAQLEKNLDRNEEKAKAYYTTMDSYIYKGYAKKLSNVEVAFEPENTWFLPHHAVTNPNKPGKTRLVFDEAASYKGTSLNDQLVTGPDLLNSLVGVIMRFRLHAIAITADIETMFFQVRVIEQDQPSLRFLWRGSERKHTPDVYQMPSMIFGAKSSPCNASYCLRQTALDNQASFVEETIEAVLTDFYMDDLLKSLPSELEATTLALQMIDLLSRGGFHLTKFMSNSREVLSKLSIPRCYIKGEGRIVDRQLHVFADASETAFGSVAYLRFQSEDGIYHCSFVFGKARLAPIKPLSVPR